MSQQSIREEVTALLGKRALVCASDAVVCKPSPEYLGDGDIVGEVSTIGADHFYLVGWSFVTRVLFDDVRAIWVRDQAPDPCPHCGGTDAKTGIQPRKETL